MTTQNRDYTEEEQQVFDYYVYEGKAREVGRGLSTWGYLKLREVGFPDDPEIFERYLIGQWDNEEEAVKARAERLNMDEDFIQKYWSQMNDMGHLIVLHLENGCVIIYSSYVNSRL